MVGWRGSRLKRPIGVDPVVPCTGMDAETVPRRGFSRDSGAGPECIWCRWLVLATAAPPGYPVDENDEPILDSTIYGVYGNSAYHADLRRYYDQISDIRLIPLPGDANLDGRVDLEDFVILRQSFGQSGSGLPADFDGINGVEMVDLDILQSNFGLISGSGYPPSADAPDLKFVLAPEPATLCVLAASAPLLLRSRKRRRGVKYV